MARSEWYSRAMQAINARLLPLSLAEVRAAGRRGLRLLLGGSYPFGGRDGHPYKMWCRAIRDKLDELFPPHQPEATGEVRISPIYGVICTWCSGAVCLVCSEDRAAFVRLAAERPKDHERWLEWDKLAAQDEDERLILADWLADVLGLEREADLLRGQGVPKKPRVSRAKKPKRRPQR